jgi:S1-C subfamily serine protease
MRVLLRYFFVAMLSSLGTFALFYHYTWRLIAAAPVEESASGKLVSSTAFPVNTKPGEWNMQSLPDFTGVARQITHAVVTVSALGTTGYRMSSGSGVIVSEDGYIVTNYHVIEDAQRFEVVLPNKRTLAGKLVGYDPGTDLALLKINAERLVSLPFGDSEQVQVGQWVLAVGNPFDLNSTITAGIVSAKARNLHILEGKYAVESFIQTDAVVNPGNSGGALVNAQGELVGINTAIISESGRYEGYSFAIPANLVHKVITDLRDYGKVQRAILGISIEDVNDRRAVDLALPYVEGVVIRSVYPGSSAYEAGLRINDVIVSVNTTKVTSVAELQEQMALLKPGDRIGIEFYRDGRKYRSDNILLKSPDLDTSYR